MRDTKALRAARENESDPYRRRFTYPKWNRTVTVTDVPKLFQALPEFRAWTRVDHERVARQYLEQMLADERVFADILQRYERMYGTSGSLISGGFRESWPDFAKDACRWFSARLTDFSEKSFTHWLAAGRRDFTWRSLRDECRYTKQSPLPRCDDADIR